MSPFTIVQDVLTGIPRPIRQALYAAFALAVLIHGALSVADVDTGATGDVLAYLGGVLGLQAAVNSASAPNPRTAEPDADDATEREDV